MTKERLYEIMDLGIHHDTESRVFDYTIIALILANVTAVILETVPSIYTNYENWFHGFEVFSAAIFTIEYFLRLWASKSQDGFRGRFGRVKFALTPMAVVDFIAVAPTYLPLFGIFGFDMIFLRSFRLYRLIRIFKLGRYSQSARMLFTVISDKKSELLVTMGMMVCLLVCSSSLVWLVEHEAQPDAFKSIPHAMWWGVATLSTVGYGDVYPITPLGRVFAAIIAMIGIGMFALPAGILASGFSEYVAREKDEEDQICPHCGKEL